MAREARLPANEHGIRELGTVYASEQVHMSIPKAVALLGHRTGSAAADSLRRRIPDAYRLAAAVDRSRYAGREDPDRDCRYSGNGRDRQHRSVTGVGGSCEGCRRMVSRRWRLRSAGRDRAAARCSTDMDLADSISLDPHKWLYQPLDMRLPVVPRSIPGTPHLLFYRRLRQVAAGKPVESFAFFEQSVELSRRFRALKLWLSLRYHGLDNFRQQIENDLECAQTAWHH